MRTSNAILGAMILPLLFIGVEPGAAIRAPRRAPARVSPRRVQRRREWHIPIGISAHADEKVAATRDDREFSVEIRFMSREKVIEECKALGVWGPNPVIPKNYVGGCNVFFLDKKHCVVIAPEPRFVDDTATTVLGHEVLHCARGRYHQ